MNSPTLVRLPQLVEEMMCGTDFCRLYEQALFDPSQAAKQKPAVRSSTDLRRPYEQFDPSQAAKIRGGNDVWY